MRPLLFIDFDGTICHDRFWRSVEPRKQILIQQSLFAGEQKLVSDWMRGKYTSEDINTFLAEKINVPYRLLWEIFQKDCKTMWVSKDTLEGIALLRKKFTTILATDNMDCFSRFTAPALRLNRYFDDTINSADIGLCKGDAEGKFFISVAEKYTLPITESSLIDNSEKVCRMFRRLGGTSCLVTSELPAAYWLEILLAST